MPELTPQYQAQQIAALSAWVLRERDFLRMLLEAKLNFEESKFVMTSEVC
jgi:hypothetical protein